MKSTILLLREHSMSIMVTVLVIVILFGFTLRFMGTNYGLPYIHHWDEPQLVIPSLRMMLTGDYNPHFFVYPAFSMYAGLVVDMAVYYSLLQKPAEDPHGLTRLDEIEIGEVTGDRWKVSHPAFYRGNRLLTAFFGTLSILLTFLIGRHCHGRAAGLLAAAIVASNGYLITNATYVATDVPMATFLLAAIWYACLFEGSLRWSHFRLMLIFIGLAMATKYNAVFALLMPLVVYARQWRKIDRDGLTMLFLIFAIPFLVFFLFNPYVLLDLPVFLTDSGSTIWAYQNKGALESGNDAVTYHLQKIRTTIDPFLFYAGCLGFFMMFGRFRKNAVLLVFWVVYFRFMTAQQAETHRNLVIVYHFLAVSAAGFLVFLAGSASRARQWFADRSTILRRRDAILTGIAVLFCVPLLISVFIVGMQSVTQWRHNHSLYVVPETRTRAIHYLNALIEKEKMTNASIGISRELGIHRTDLARLAANWSEFGHQDIQKAIATYDVVLTTQFKSYVVRSRQADAAYNSVLPRELIFHTISGKPARLGSYSDNPTVFFLRRGEEYPIIHWQGKTMAYDLSESPIELRTNDRLSSSIRERRPGSYSLIIRAAGSGAPDGINAHIVVFHNDLPAHDFFLEREYRDYTVDLTLERNADNSLAIVFDNDHKDFNTQEDRNVLIAAIRLKKS